MVRENYDDSLTVSRCPSCLYGKLLSINKPEGFDTAMFSACTFVTRWLCNHDLASPCIPFSCYHHPSYKLLKQSKMPTTESECHLFQQTSKNYFETIWKISLPYPNSSTDTLGLANTASNNAPQNNCWLHPKVKRQNKNTRLLYFKILNKWFLSRKFQTPTTKSYGSS